MSQVRVLLGASRGGSSSGRTIVEENGAEKSAPTATSNFLMPNYVLQVRVLPAASFFKAAISVAALTYREVVKWSKTAEPYVCLDKDSSAKFGL